MSEDWKPQWLLDHEALPTWKKIANRLTDAGIDDDDARDWVREAMAEAWQEGHDAGDTQNPYGVIL